MRKFVLSILAFLALAGIGVFVAFQLTSDIVSVADKFFVSVQQRDAPRAYQDFLSEDFRAATSLDEFEAFLSASALTEFAGASWSARSFSGNQGELEGSVTTKDGGEIPLTLSFVKENGEWKILSIRKAAAGLIVETEVASRLPIDEELASLASSSLQSLGLAINAADFSDFYESISALWQAQTSPGALHEVFRDFSDRDIDLTALAGIEPVFSQAPALNADNVLALNGYYPTRPYTTRFEFEYVYEHPRWKLIGINVSVNQQSEN